MMDFGMIDLHMHLIPGVDDGAVDERMSLAMLLRAREEGIRAVFATPHSSAFDHAPEAVARRFAHLREQAGQYFPDLELKMGCEVFCDAFSMEQTLRALSSGRYPTLNGKRYVLTEFSQWVLPEHTVPCVEALVKAGYLPVIAHMERYLYLRENMALVDRFRELGARIQVNAYSLYDETEESVKNWARRLVLERKADYLGSDAHSTGHRPPKAKNGLHWLYQSVEREYADALARGNAEGLF